MKEDLDSALCKKYPKIFVNPNSSEQESRSYFGFECEDGWYNILDKLCENIQRYIDWKNSQRERIIARNQMIIDAGRNPRDWAKFDEYYKEYTPGSREIERKRIISGERDIDKVPAGCPQVIVQQVKEKFGSLRFYYQGGDECIEGMVRIAEAISEITCEECGSPGIVRRGGWVRTLCNKHENEYQQRKDYE